MIYKKASSNLRLEYHLVFGVFVMNLKHNSIHLNRAIGSVSKVLLYYKTLITGHLTIK